ncbi:MAG TPA: monofunctional biosynthetic peptidoglycan transglycosylase [Nevskia sp.]|nr:monofunctional biosynthetic peptidoglycan transglycosylase [Nevskia sp.]
MKPRIEPSLEPAAPPAPGAPEALRIDPAHRPGYAAARPAPAPERRRSSSWFGRLFTLFLLLCLLPVVAIVALRWLPPPVTSYMLQSPTQPVQYHWVPADRIAEVARRAVVAAEDQKFWTHRGFDLEAIRKAEAWNQDPRHRNRRRGASTISQQTAKNLFLWPGGYVRKGIEAGLTVLLEKLWGKKRILEVYLNVVEFGPGVYGVEAAAQKYFNKPASQLTAEEAARLAAVLPNPRHWSVAHPGAYVQARTAWIMGQMGYGSRNTPAQEPVPPADEMPDDEDYLPRDAAPPAPGLPPEIPLDEEQQPDAPGATAAPPPQGADPSAAPTPPPSDAPPQEAQPAPAAAPPAGPS